MIPQGTRVRSLPGRLYHPWDKREDACSSRLAVFWVMRPNTTPSRSTSNTRISNWPGSARIYFATPRPELAHVAHLRANHPQEPITTFVEYSGARQQDHYPNAE